MADSATAKYAQGLAGLQAMEAEKGQDSRRPSQAEVMTISDSRSLDRDGADSDSGADSDYGLSDRQMVEVWDKFQDGNSELGQAVSFLAASFTGVVEDGGTASFEGASFRMISPEEVAEGGEGSPRSGGAERSPRSAGSTRSPGKGLGARKAKSETSEKDEAAEKGEDKKLVVVEDLPEAAAEREHGANANLRVSLVSSRQIEKVTWYLFKVEEGNDVRLFMKRFNDFKKLDTDLRTKGTPGLTLIDLPPSGMFGVRHRLNLGDFNEKRRQGLERYVQQVCMQIDGLGKEPVLRKFFGSKASGRVLPNV